MRYLIEVTATRFVEVPSPEEAELAACDMEAEVYAAIPAAELNRRILHVG